MYFNYLFIYKNYYMIFIGVIFINLISIDFNEKIIYKNIGKIFINLDYVVVILDIFIDR